MPAFVNLRCPLGGTAPQYVVLSCIALFNSQIDRVPILAAYSRESLFVRPAAPLSTDSPRSRRPIQHFIFGLIPVAQPLRCFPLTVRMIKIRFEHYYRPGREEMGFMRPGAKHQD